jgi:hypothetical protein
VYRKWPYETDPPSREFYQLCIGLGNQNSGQGPTKGCKAITTTTTTMIISIYLNINPM